MMMLFYAILLIVGGIFVAPENTELLFYGMAVIMLKLSDIEDKLKILRLFYFKGDEGSAILFGDVKEKVEKEEPKEAIAVTKCLKCDEAIPDGEDTCECGWTWRE